MCARLREAAAALWLVLNESGCEVVGSGSGGLWELHAVRLRGENWLRGVAALFGGGFGSLWTFLWIVGPTWTGLDWTGLDV